jgi:hypothetical protein
VWYFRFFINKYLIAGLVSKHKYIYNINYNLHSLLWNEQLSANFIGRPMLVPLWPQPSCIPSHRIASRPSRSVSEFTHRPFGVWSDDRVRHPRPVKRPRFEGNTFFFFLFINLKRSYPWQWMGMYNKNNIIKGIRLRFAWATIRSVTKSVALSSRTKIDSNIED